MKLNLEGIKFSIDFNLAKNAKLNSTRNLPAMQCIFIFDFKAMRLNHGVSVGKLFHKLRVLYEKVLSSRQD
jgi:hypothetical protein